MDNNIQKKYDELSHPGIGGKPVKEQTLEGQKQELEDSVVQSLYQDKIRREMDKIRKEMNKIREEWKPWVENSVTDTHKVIYEAERRVKDGR